MSDVARLAGVSTMTVSRVLNETSKVTEGVRQRVFSAIEQLRYQPNELARSLREQRSRQIGVLVPYLFDPFFATCAHVIGTVAQEHAYSVILSTSNEDQQLEYAEASRMLRRNVDGLVLIPTQPHLGRSLLLSHEFDRMPIVTLDRPVEGSGFDSLLVENELGSKRGTEHLLSLGHQRITFMGLSNGLYTMRTRHAGYRSAMQAAGYPPRSIELSGTLEESMNRVRELLHAPHAPTAFFCANNLITRHVLHGLQALDVHPPDKVALVGFDDFETADLLRPGITVVRQPTEQLGRDAAKALFARLNGSLPAGHITGRARETVLPVELVVRGSCGARPSLALSARRGCSDP